MKFRATKSNNNFAIESSNGGAWTAGLIVLHKDDVQKQMDRLHSHGSVIVDTADFAFTATPTPPKKKKETVHDDEPTAE